MTPWNPTESHVLMEPTQWIPHTIPFYDPRFDMSPPSQEVNWAPAISFPALLAVAARRRICWQGRKFPRSKPSNGVCWMRHGFRDLGVSEHGVYHQLATLRGKMVMNQWDWRALQDVGKSRQKYRGGTCFISWIAILMLNLLPFKWGNAMPS